MTTEISSLPPVYESQPIRPAQPPAKPASSAASHSLPADQLTLSAAAQQAMHGAVNGAAISSTRVDDSGDGMK